MALVSVIRFRRIPRTRLPACIESGAPMAARCTDNGVHFTGAYAGNVDAVFFAKAFQP